MQDTTYRILSIARRGIWALPALLFATQAAADSASQFLPQIAITSTVPANGDLNPYGVAIVPAGFPPGSPLAPGDVLISNFNNVNNLQGTGMTIVQYRPNGQVAPAGQASVFFTSPNPGLTTALGVLQGGFVVVGAVTTTDGTIGTIKAGPLLFLDRHGKMVAPSPYTAMLDGPWDLTIFDQVSQAKVFVSNVLNGSVTRLDLIVGNASVTVVHAAVIATGYTVQPNAAALILGPTGLVYDPQSDSLFVASTADNAIFRVTQAGSRSTPAGPGTVIFQGDQLRGPLAMQFAPNGNLIAANGDAVNSDPTQPSELVEFTLGGQFVGQSNVDPGQGGAFGFAIRQTGAGTTRLATIDDNTAALTVNDRAQ